MACYDCGKARYTPPVVNIGMRNLSIMQNYSAGVDYTKMQPFDYVSTSPLRAMGKYDGAASHDEGPR